MLAVVNYGSGNVAAISAVLSTLRVTHAVVSHPADLVNAERYILPGVGAFDPTMARLEEMGFKAELERQVKGEGKKLLGICVGMQLLSDTSEEGELPGFGWVSGKVRKIDTSGLNRPPYLPHMGWNSLDLHTASPLFDGIDLAQGFYFLHSYFFDAAVEGDVLATTQYGGDIPCAVASGNVFGVQFHPEKSHANGVRLLKNFAELV